MDECPHQGHWHGGGGDGCRWVQRLGGCKVGWVQRLGGCKGWVGAKVGWVHGRECGQWLVNE